MRTSRLATALVALLAIAPATARGAETFEYVADRVEIDGTSSGPTTAFPIWSTSSTTGPLAPNWAVSSGTASESDGLLRLQSPGLTSG